MEKEQVNALWRPDSLPVLADPDRLQRYLHHRRKDPTTPLMRSSTIIIFDLK